MSSEKSTVRKLTMRAEVTVTLEKRPGEYEEIIEFLVEPMGHAAEPGWVFDWAKFHALVVMSDAETAVAIQFLPPTRRSITEHVQWWPAIEKGMFTGE